MRNSTRTGKYPNPLLVEMHENNTGWSPETLKAVAHIKYKVHEIYLDEHYRGIMELTENTLANIRHAQKVLSRLGGMKS